MRLLPLSGSVYSKILIRGLFLALGLQLGQFQAAALTFTVTNTNDTGAGSLRQAILDANANSGLDTIEFQIAGIPPLTISPGSALPALSGPVNVNATTQLGYIGQPLVELNFAAAGSILAGLQLSGGNSTVRGLAINRVTGHGIWLNSANNIMQGNYIGTDVTGIIARGNTQTGILVNQSGNRIGGTNAADRNVISGGNLTGVYILTGTSNLVQGNYIGLNALGTADLGNLNNGIVVYDSGAPHASGNIIGGATPGARNVISGNDSSGIYVFGQSATATLIQGNYIGLNAAGTTTISNIADGITIENSPANQISGNVISGNGQAGVFLNGAGTSGNRIQGNNIGTDPAGLLALGNRFAGVTLSGAISNIIGGASVAARNIISGNKADGIYAVNCQGTAILGNHIGLNTAAGALGNTTTGITLDNSPSNFIGGSAAGEANIISGNANIGVWLHNSLTTGNLIRGNLIGTDPGGTTAIGNGWEGIRITGAPGNTIGGTGLGDKNVISGNGFASPNWPGIAVEGATSFGNRFFGNYIGTDLNGQNALPNRYEGIYANASRSNIIGSELPGGGNLISGNTTCGIRFADSSYNTVLGNFLGTKADGIASLPNGQFNVVFETGCNTNSVGGTSAGAGNRIAYTGNYAGGPYAGVRVRTPSAYNAILGNSIFGNSGLGIAFSGLSATANDGCDTDAGGNLQQNFPELSQAVSGATTGVRGVLPSRANTTFRLQFFASQTCDGSGNGEGQIYLGDKFVTTDGACSTAFVAGLPVAVPPGYVVTATATDPANNTSEFSACIPVTASPRLAINALNATQISLAWTNVATGFVLKETTNLSPPVVWTTVTNVPANVGGQFQVTLARKPGNQFYLLNFE